MRAKYCLHKGTNRAFVRICGKTHYLGKYDSAANVRKYVRLKNDFHVLGDLFEGRFRDVEWGTFFKKLMGFVGGHQTHGEQDGFADFDGGELPLHIPSSIERHETVAVFGLIQASWHNDFAEG